MRKYLLLPINRSSMTLVSNDPSWWPLINANLIISYFAVTASTGVLYDWALTLGQEVELVWRQQWSLMTVLYLSSSFMISTILLIDVPTIPVTDVVSHVIYVTLEWTSEVVNVILGVIMIARLYAMCQRSRKVLMFLVVIFLAVTITNEVVSALSTRYISGEELILSGTYQCTIVLEGDSILLSTITWILGIVWEVLALCLAVWIAVQHFRELRRHLAGGIIGDCFIALMQTHMIYFASFLAISCLRLGFLSPTILADPYSTGTQIYTGFVQILQLAQMFVLGPRLVLGVREYKAKLVADCDAEIGMSSIAFQERVHVSTSSSV
ncbi:uncharacterized protein EDB91DRAFT_211254 [Suillus paluster]|uniref:uncharacterized protein n=1 Tax=Suillus paluster TaxID=48578 RepID=UPI001B861AF9|nr:uncharacterized protein EDB91DRAFT_211254 [Suillus paluster]KAG1744128.1 hypothetical protein EDB91DRAFT_211254 [Suillus paluster]